MSSKSNSREGSIEYKEIPLVNTQDNVNIEEYKKKEINGSKMMQKLEILYA